MCAKPIKTSETVTENIFRDFYGANVFIKKSAIPKKYGFISKNKTEHVGYPDFFLDDGLIFIVEAKAINHKNAEQELLFYMNNNSFKEDKDILGIAISGQGTSKFPLVVSYFIKFSTDDPSVLDVDNSLLGLENLKKVYQKKKAERFSGSISNLTKTLSALNSQFQKENIVRDTERSLFFSGLMIALKDNTFRRTYQTIEKPSGIKSKEIEASILNDQIIDAISRQLEGKINNYSKKFNWSDKFAFIRNIDCSLDTYKEIIKQIEKNIFIPFENEEKLDILGKAYKIFLKRAGKVDNKNIILTPDHIKSLMVRLSNLNVNDIVLDTCTGTGGFLMEAMEVMIKQALQNTSKITHIKEHQLIGFEIDPVLFALACSNMFLHGDGRTNLIFRSSLIGDSSEHIVNSRDDEILKFIKEQKPTKVIINPPYENNKSIEFVRQAIEYLEPNGKLVVIMPTPTLTFNIKNGLTHNILQIASLDFVIRMPDKLFVEQKRTVNTSIFGFTKKPHNQQAKVLFYNLSDDGFVSVQHKGRIDKKETWKEKEDAVVESILNNEEIQGVSFKRRIYTQNGTLIPMGIREESDDKNYYTIGEIFLAEKGSLASEQAEDDGEYTFVTAGETWKTHTEYTHDTTALIIAVAASGSLGRTHYISGKFIASNLCLILTVKEEWKEKLNLEFMAVYIDSIKDELKYNLADGTSKLTIREQALLEYKIKIPELSIQNKYYDEYIAPLKEQKKILEQQAFKMENALKLI